MQTIPTTSPADASAVCGANRFAPQAALASDPRRFAELLQQRREAQPRTTAQAEPKPSAPPKSDPAARPNVPLPRKTPAGAGDRPAAQRAENGADDGSRATSTARAAAKSETASKDATQADARERPIADAPIPASATALGAPIAGAAADAIGTADGTEDGAISADATPRAPGADPTFWPGMPAVAAQDSHAAGGNAPLDLRIGAGGATAAPGNAGNPAAGSTLAGGGAGNATDHGTGGQSAGDPRGDAAADDAAALLAAAAADSKTTATASASADRFALPARATEAALPGWVGGVPPHRMDGHAPSQVALPTPLGAPDFAKALGAQVSVFARNGLAHAELQLTPAEMGPIRVQIAIDGAHARVDFAADSAATRQVIERGLPELASALREQGLTLSGGGVFQRAPDQNGEPAENHPARGRARRRALPTAIDAVEPRSRARTSGAHPGGVDLYA